MFARDTSICKSFGSCTVSTNSTSLPAYPQCVQAETCFPIPHIPHCGQRTTDHMGHHHKLKSGRFDPGRIAGAAGAFVSTLFAAVSMAFVADFVRPLVLPVLAIIFSESGRIRAAMATPK